MNGYGKPQHYNGDPYARGAPPPRGGDPYYGGRGPPAPAMEDPYGQYRGKQQQVVDDPYGNYRGKAEEDPYGRRGEELPPGARVLFNADYDHGIDYGTFVNNLQSTESVAPVARPAVREGVDYRRGVPSDARSMPSDHRGIPSDLRGIPSDPRGLPSDHRGVPSDPRGMPSDPRGVPSDLRGMPSDPRGVPSDHRGMPSDPRGMPSDHRGMPSDQRGMPTELRGVPSDPRGVPSDHRGMPSDPRGMPSNHRGMPSDPRGGPRYDHHESQSIAPPSYPTTHRRAPAQNGGPVMREEDPYGMRGPPAPKEDMYSRPQRHNGHSAEPSADGMYNLDHLATFTVGPKQGLMSPSDGIHKLRQMETTSGIWTMRVQLVMDRRDLLILDKQTGEEMERFPLDLLSDIEAVTNQDRRDIYNNIVLFTVMSDPYKRAPAEMHLFQVLGNPAQDVVDDIMAAKGGGRTHQYRPPPRDQLQVRNQVQQYEIQAQHAATVTDAYRPGPTRPRDAFQQSIRTRDAGGRDDTDIDTVISERTEKDVRRSSKRSASPLNNDPLLEKISTEDGRQLLNHCFDDIERFVGRLQQAAEAFKELDKRRTRQSGGRGRGDGMLTMRARPPPAKDFIDIFQKFKLSFNLLAKLKPHIHDPNAPELVHFLFTPLSLVAEASKDPRQGTPDLAAKVVSPLLTADAKDLLLNCLTSKEADLWMSLGDAWKLSRDEWKSYVPPYFPRFSDGWQPTGFEDEYRRRSDDPGHANARNSGGNGSYYQEQQPQSRDRDPRDDDRGRYGYDRDRDAREREDREREREARERDIREREAREREDREREAREREAREREAAAARERERRERDARDRAPPPQQQQGNGSQAAYLRELQTKGAIAYEVIHDRQGQNEKELSVHKGDIVEVVDKRRNWWKVMNSKGQSGHVPYTILQQPDSSSSSLSAAGQPSHESTNFEAARDNVMRKASSAANSRRPTSPIPAIAQPLPHLGNPTSHPPRPTSTSKQEDSHSNPSPTPAHRGPSKPTDAKAKSKASTEPITITMSSTPEDVKKWLKAKGFSSSTRQILSGKNGQQMFKLEKDQLERMCGKKEGATLFSQIQLAKNMTGYNTTRVMAIELDAILKQRREKADSDSTSQGYEDEELDSASEILYQDVLGRR